MTIRILDVVRRNRLGVQVGMPSYCTAHGETLRAIFRFYRANELPVLVEATCNQVNQEGGYTGMTPAAYRDFVFALAKECGLDAGRIILGGDHLGPNPWKQAGAAEAMEKAHALVAAYVEAGFTKIHLDASMACADDADLTEAEIARRAASMASVAEAAAAAECVYVIGTEVPTPGGETEDLGALAVTEPVSVRLTYDRHHEAFLRLGLGEAFGRVVGLVVQPGVDFGNSQVFGFDRVKASALSDAVADLPDIVFEAHSTDYQTGGALADLVASHFAILKVGPELTAAYREAVVAMAAIEDWLPGVKKSGILAVVDAVMARDPKHWRAYVSNGPRAGIERLFGLSDRIRYYWPNAEIRAALDRLCANIDAASGEIGLIWQFAGPLEAADGLPLSQRIVQAKIGAVAAKYSAACRP